MVDDALSELHQHYSGPIPKPARLAAKRGGSARREACRAAAALREYETLAAEARLAAARRRAALARPWTDPWLARLGAALIAYRHAALKLRDAAGAP